MIPTGMISSQIADCKNRLSGLLERRKLAAPPRNPTAREMNGHQRCQFPYLDILPCRYRSSVRNPTSSRREARGTRTLDLTHQTVPVKLTLIKSFRFNEWRAQGERFQNF